jgi:hypothetical protein
MSDDLLPPEELFSSPRRRILLYGRISNMYMRSRMAAEDFRDLTLCQSHEPQKAAVSNNYSYVRMK